ncbi:DNA adenine methylase [Aminobacter ciceronei]|jgi:DNA adenine methylase|uniref:DNA adenine methylase n=1 Tax=Aminobacter ciceronei TaxID=150723 RepID=UPI003F70D0C1
MVGLGGMEVIRAPLRWAGSKRKSVGTLKRLVPDNVTHYVEPFAGSACLAFALEPSSVVLGDINPQLIEFYEYLKEMPIDLHTAYSQISSNPVSYYRVREEYNAAGPSLGRAAQFLYLNRHCFNGIYRVNNSGKFNVPWGGDKVGKALTQADISRASLLLDNARLICGDFEAVVCASIRPGTLVYLDPPYASNESRVFREYHEDSFATSDWERLMRVLRYIDDAGAHFLLSYAGSSSFMEQLGNWHIGHLDVTRNVGGFRASRRKYREFVATNYKVV